MSAKPPEGGGAAGLDLVFVGGTGRSGTHALAALIGRHSHFADVGVEARFHCNKRGLPDLLEGRITLASYLEKLRGFWWHRVRVDGRPRGLYNLMTRHDFDLVVDRFEARFPDDPLGAGRELFCGLLAPTAQRAGKPGLVEMSSHNVRESQTLLRLFPEARIIHAVRDGRDSAASVTTKTWGPASVAAGIGWWQERMIAIEAGVRGSEDGAGFGVPPQRFMPVLLDELVGGGHERCYRGLLEFLGVDDEPGISAYFEREMTAEAAHIGRWRRQLGPVGRRRVDRRYERALVALERGGHHAAPLLRAWQAYGVPTGSDVGTQ
ncbi:MAG: sulfotransferase [Solirubrobacterales bacterium]